MRQIKGQRNRGRSCEVLPGGRERDPREKLERKPAWEEKKRTGDKERISLLSAAGMVLEPDTGKALPPAGRGGRRTRPERAAGAQQRSGLLEARTTQEEGKTGGFAAPKAAGAAPGEGQPGPAPAAGSQGINPPVRVGAITRP